MSLARRMAGYKLAGLPINDINADLKNALAVLREELDS